MTRISVVVLLLAVSFSSSFAQQGSASTQTNRPSQPDLKGDIQLDFGMNMWSEDAERLRLDIWKSQSFGAYYNRMFKLTDRITFNPAAGLGFEKYAFNDDFTWLPDAQGIISFDTLTGVQLTKNKLQTTYFEIPLELRFYPFKTVTGEGFFVSVGAIAGARINTVAKIKYPAGSGEVKNKLNQRLGVHDYRYGAQFRLGWRSFHVYYKYYLSNLFDGSPDGSGISPTTSTFGFTFSGF
ncbi:MAG: hypothetical protein ACFHWX_22535 [Bacteroidota bacterium]